LPFSFPHSCGLSLGVVFIIICSPTFLALLSNFFECFANFVLRHAGFSIIGNCRSALGTVTVLIGIYDSSFVVGSMAG